MPNEVQVVAVTASGAYIFNSLAEALEHSIVSLATPIFKKDGPIDRTLIRGAGLSDYSTQDPWEFLTSRATPAPVDIKPVRRKKGSTCGK